MMLREDRHQRVIPYLPLTAELPDGRTVIIDYLTYEQMQETYNQIKTCAEDGDGFGLEEYSSEEEFRNETKDGFCFGVVCRRTGKLLSSFVLGVSKFYRGNSEVVDPYIIVNKAERQKGIGEFCMRKILFFSEILGFRGMYLDTFCNNTAMQRILEKIGGFVKVGILPMGGRLKNGHVVASLIYFRDIIKSSDDIT